MPPATPIGGTTTTITHTTYKAAPGQVLDVPDADAQALANVGWSIIGAVGPTSSRQATVVPTTPIHVDTTLGTILYYDGAAYRDNAGKAH
jgi:hypothetical protein